MGGAWAAIRGQRAAGWPPRRRRRKHPGRGACRRGRCPAVEGSCIVCSCVQGAGGGHIAPRAPGTAVGAAPPPARRLPRRRREAQADAAAPIASHLLSPPTFSARAATRRPARTRGVGARTAGARGRRRPAAGRPTLMEAMLGGRAAGKKGWEGKGCVRRAPATLHTPVRPLLRGLARTFRGPTPPPGCAPRPPGPPHPCGVRAASRPAAACPPAPAGALWTPTG